MQSDVERWLEGLGLLRHAALFAENLIDFEVLSELTDEDLRELGLALGDRKKLLRAVRAWAKNRTRNPIRRQPPNWLLPTPSAADSR